MKPTAQLVGGLIAILLITAGVGGMVGVETAETAENVFSLRWWSVDSGAGAVAGAEFTLAGVPGQFETTSSGGTYTLIGGTPIEPISTDITITGLEATCNALTVFGTPTHFHGTIDSGTNVQFLWEFGDGASASGADVMHTYTTAGSYTATLTASNFIGSQQVSMRVSVVLEEEIERLYLPAIQKALDE